MTEKRIPISYQQLSAMISEDYPTVSWYLLIVGFAFLVGSALPLLIVPLKWGKAFGWSLPENDQFTVYLGRCLGAVATALSIAVFRAAPNPVEHKETLYILMGSAILLMLVHVYGAIRRVQPWQENLELVMYFFLVGYGLYLLSSMS
jgi:small-conductance mechanosensitive channel